MKRTFWNKSDTVLFKYRYPLQIVVHDIMYCMLRVISAAKTLWSSIQLSFHANRIMSDLCHVCCIVKSGDAVSELVSLID